MPRKDEALLIDALTELPDNYLMCRDVRHAWDVTQDYHVTQGGRNGQKVREIRRVLTCLRCQTQRLERYLPTRNTGLDKVGQAYRYPGGHVDDDRPKYQIKGATRGNKPSSLVQGEAYRRSLERQAGARRGERLRAV